MMLHQLTLAVLFTLVATTTHSVDAHGKLLKPEAKMRADSKLGDGAQYDFVGEIDGKKVFPQTATGGKLQWGRAPEKNQAQFAEQFAAAGYTSLRQFFQANDQLMVPRFRSKTDNVCGFTDPAAAPSTLPADGVLEWGNNAGKWGFQDNHHGPCEVWCDNTLVMQNNNCRAAFGKELPARMPIDLSRCNGAARLQFLWLAVHFTKWQYWLNCIPLAATVALPAEMPVANVTGPSVVPMPVAQPAAGATTGAGAGAVGVPVVVPQVMPVVPVVPVVPAAPAVPVPVAEPISMPVPAPMQVQAQLPTVPAVAASMPVVAPTAPAKTILGNSPQRQGY